jgi:hypothetical protein
LRDDCKRNCKSGKIEVYFSLFSLLINKKKMLSTTRFDEITWQENCAYRKKHNLSGPIYCAPMKMRETIPIDTLVFVIEMKNLKKKRKKDSGGCIEGIGLIKNRFIPTEERFKFCLYKEGNYERYIYKGSYRIDRNILQNYNLKLVEILDDILFNGKTHLKRGNGFMRVPDKLVKDLDIDVLDEIKQIFLKHFKKEGDKEEIEGEKENKDNAI